MSERKSLIPSLEMRMYYNNTLCERLVDQLPRGCRESKYVDRIMVRAQWDHDSELPKRVTVNLRMADGTLLRIKTPLYNFPDPEVVAKIGILL